MNFLNVAIIKADNNDKAETVYKLLNNFIKIFLTDKIDHDFLSKNPYDLIIMIGGDGFALRVINKYFK